jgi:glycosyltransferase involved in cell wall biosynthesis
MDLSFVIPAYNEEKTLPATISAIQENVPSTLSFEVIVVDNGSTDGTADVAINSGARLLSIPEGTIGALRNAAVKVATGSILVFVDADVLLTSDWKRNAPDVLQRVRENPDQITGSRYSVPDRPGWIERFRYAPLLKGNDSYMNSGHLIISRDLFTRLGGFAEELETAEDYEFSMRARSRGIKIVPAPELRVVHLGFPQTLGAFFMKEIWHGKGDCASFSAFLHSPVAMAGQVYLWLEVLALLDIVLLHTGVIAFAAVFVTVSIAFLAAVKKYRRDGLATVCVNTLLYYAYYTARGVALIARMLAPTPTKTERPRRQQ